jgi:hypothetical protein
MKTLFTAILFGALFLVQPAHAFGWDDGIPTERDYAELNRLLNPHIWHGKPVSHRVRAAAGNANMIVLDRRRFSYTSECSFRIYRNQRIMDCR